MYADLKLRSHLLINPELTNVIPLNPGIGQSIATHASPNVSIFCFVFPFFLVGCAENTKLKNIEWSSQTITETLTLSTVIQSFHKTFRLMNMVLYHQSWNKVWMQRKQQFRRYRRNGHILIMWALDFEQRTLNDFKFDTFIDRFPNDGVAGRAVKGLI